MKMKFNFIRDQLKDVEFRMNKELLHIIYKAVKKDGRSLFQKFFDSRYFKALVLMAISYAVFRVTKNVNKSIKLYRKRSRKRAKLAYDVNKLEKQINFHLSQQPEVRESIRSIEKIFA